MSQEGNMARGRGGRPGTRLARVARTGGQNKPEGGDRASVARRQSASGLGDVVDSPRPTSVSDADEIAESNLSTSGAALMSDPLDNDTRTGGTQPATIRGRRGSSGKADVVRSPMENDTPRGGGAEVPIDGEQTTNFSSPQNSRTTGDGNSVRISGERTVRGRAARRRQGSERSQT